MNEIALILMLFQPLERCWAIMDSNGKNFFWANSMIMHKRALHRQALIAS